MRKILALLFVLFLSFCTPLHNLVEDAEGRGDGKSVLYQGSCSDGGDVGIETYVHQQIIVLDQSDTTGFDLYYQPPGTTAGGQDAFSLYDAGYEAGDVDDSGLMSNGPDGYAPIPAGLNTQPTKLWAAPSSPYPGYGPPRYINIFLGPQVSLATFDSIANCLDKNQSQINAALKTVQQHYPARDESSIVPPMVLGGITLGAPPSTDPRYISLENALWKGNPYRH